MKATATSEETAGGQEPWASQARALALEDELATLAAHLNAAGCRFLERLAAFLETGTLVEGEAARWVAFRFGLSAREAREQVRVAEALGELPAIRAAFARGELTFAKVRALTRVATPASEERLLELACALSASQLERALRAFRRVAAEEARETHELEYVDYHFAEDGSLYLRARLAAEDGTLVVKALEAARERVLPRRRRRGAARRRLPAPETPVTCPPSRSTRPRPPSSPRARRASRRSLSSRRPRSPQPPRAASARASSYTSTPLRSRPTAPAAASSPTDQRSPRRRRAGSAATRRP
ncbi:MAG: hypothetical protein KatS3mg012_0984 [Gaiellaceae bacterium]|nr:MAG: hypothetical protein KatS3mg012_0984 [Gaiellaceae bacterium]